MSHPAAPPSDSLDLPVADADARERFFTILASSLDEASFERLTLAKYRGAEAGLERLLVRRVRIRNADALSFVFRHRTRDLTHNHDPATALQQLRGLLGPGGFKAAHLQTQQQDIQLLLNRKDEATLHTRVRTPPGTAREPTSEADTATSEIGLPHNREKERPVDIRRPFLHELGVTTQQHQIVPAMARKWKQINKFIEIVGHALGQTGLLSGGRPVRVMDFGAGKGYLTFALHDHLTHTLGQTAEVIGVELRAELVDLCNDLAGRLGLQGLAFRQGDVRSHVPAELDMLIALHACDTATDEAMYAGVAGGARVILCSPCCHKQLRPQLVSPQPLRPLLRHGIHLGQEAEMLTDSLRALLLEAEGYDAQVFEFISLEHTSKNKMVLATKRACAAREDERRAAARAQVAEVKRFYGIREQALETLLQGRLSPERPDRARDAPT